MAERNQQERKKSGNCDIEYLTGRLGISATEALFVNQYLNQTPEFYNLCGDCLADMLRFNDQLTSWEFNARSTEEWLLENIPDTIGLIKNS